MIRTLFPMPAAVDWPKLTDQLRPVVTDLLGCNQVGELVAVYSTNTLADESATATVIANHTVPEWPELDVVGKMATLSAILHNDAQDWSNVTGIPVANLEAEALAWSLGGQ